MNKRTFTEAGIGAFPGPGKTRKSFSAAVAAGNAGAKTLLIERNRFLSGVATAGICSSVYNCLYTLSHEPGRYLHFLLGKRGV